MAPHATCVLGGGPTAKVAPSPVQCTHSPVPTAPSHTLAGSPWLRETLERPRPRPEAAAPLRRTGLLVLGGGGGEGREDRWRTIPSVAGTQRRLTNEAPLSHHLSPSTAIRKQCHSECSDDFVSEDGVSDSD
eukprot:TRINITY_DN3935_c0_g1_i1.p3 TRINITY_DN3935_c0_g1~~TRINITY_DN3935_c0_g1_i1.p3  ORF type:complete len:132 (+),score=12.57 TRINITY_DN3935_c0_g1_i1:69-464(+)